MFNMTPATPEEQRALFDKCQENGWIKVGGYDWQDDPWLEEYPFEFSRANTIQDLSEFFAHGNWAIRQGALFGDLAFVQQVNGGDEWWTLKRLPGEGWLAFESVSFAHILKESHSEFVRYIAGMQLASPEECKHLDYLPPKSHLVWEGDAFPDDSHGFVRVHGNGCELAVTASRIGKMLSITGPENALQGLEDENFQSLLEQLKAAVGKADELNLIPDEARNQTLTERAQKAVAASENQRRAERSSQDMNASR